MTASTDRAPARSTTIRGDTTASSSLPGALLAYSVALAALLIVPPFLKSSVGPPQGFTLQEATDLFTPVVVIPLAWLALERAGGLGRWGLAAFIVIAAAWAEGQGMHLGTNAIGDAFPDLAARDAFYRTIPGTLDHWLDETLSHWIWHVAWVALSVLLLATATRRDGARTPDARSRSSGGQSSPVPERTAWEAARSPFLLGRRLTVAAGLIYGVTFFLVTVEGGTAALGIPASIGLFGWSALTARRGVAVRPVPAFFLVAGAITLAGYAGWAALHGGTLPGFYEAGLVQ